MILRAVVAWLALAAGAAAAHTGDCSTQQGIGKARCERHEEMFRNCGSVKGPAHFDCDRSELLARPLKCEAFTGEEAARCTKEVEAFKACEPSKGRDFMQCVYKTTGESPMGH